MVLFEEFAEWSSKKHLKTAGDDDEPDEALEAFRKPPLSIITQVLCKYVVRRSFCSVWDASGSETRLKLEPRDIDVLCILFVAHCKCEQLPG